MQDLPSGLYTVVAHNWGWRFYELYLEPASGGAGASYYAVAFSQLL